MDFLLISLASSLLLKSSALLIFYYQLTQFTSVDDVTKYIFYVLVFHIRSNVKSMLHFYLHLSIPSCK